ncbi:MULTISPECIES: FecCD family ABC transporter permease [Anoxynatronum]|uniref:Iron complex transport system permease protein n=2 Tax=Anoxynatronum TaxID=210622 RepID=A0AA46AKH9_9CLOT|nr:iron ABC transporter permease [Anoxynatronum buryatiense]SMP71144.1 iron complex transport system permease protein [Anoxynatronum buryatiense]
MNTAIAEQVLNAVRKKRMWSLTFMALGLAVLMMVTLRMGTVEFTFRQVLGVFTGSNADSLARQVVYNIRLPRMLTAVMVGVNLAVSGALLQGVLRNPLASPQVIGVNAGAGLAAVSVMIFFPGKLSLLPPAAFAGALLAVLLVYGLTFHQQLNTTVSIVLAGVAVSAFLNAMTSGLMILNSDDIEVTYSWLLGGLAGRGWSYVSLIAGYTLLGVLVALLLSPKINLFLLGEEVGSSLGLRVRLYRSLIMITAAVLAGSAVSVAGTIGFVGLIAPHMTRLLVGDDYRYLTIGSGLMGGLLLLTADTVARTVFRPVELPVGVITSVLGAPFFLYLLYRGRGR